MRLNEVDRGDSIFYQILVRLISMISGMRLPDAARIVMYHRDFYGKPMTLWTQFAMRGESGWTVGERELMAAMVAKWNTCPFCIDAHSSIAALVLGKSITHSALKNFHQADISIQLQRVLTFIKKLIHTPGKLSPGDVQTVLADEVSPRALEDAIAVASLFSITVRCANALNFAMLDGKDSNRAAKRMLEQGYTFRKVTTHGHPEHQVFAETLRKRMLEGPGETYPALRQAVAQRAIGGPALNAPYDALVLKVGKTAYTITDEEVKKVVAKSGSEKAAFEIITTASTGVGLHIWKQGCHILKNTINGTNHPRKS